MKRSPFTLAAVAILSLVGVAAFGMPHDVVAHSVHHALSLSSPDIGTVLLGLSTAAGSSGKRLRDLLAKKAKLATDMRALNDKAAAESREPTAEEIAQFDALAAQIPGIDAAIGREQTLMDAEKSAGIVIPDDAKINVKENIENDPKRGFKTFGEQAAAVAAHYRGLGTDKRLAAAPATYGNEGSGGDGGFAIAPQFSSEIWRLSLGEDSLLPLTENTELSTSNSMIFPKDESTPWGSTGIQVYWQAEASSGTPSKPVLGQEAMVLHKLMALVPVTDELLADSAAIGSYLSATAPERITYKANEAILFGDGVGKPLGMLANPGAAGSACILQAKDGAQAANTISNSNLSNMVSRLFAGQLKNAIWLANPDTVPLLEAITVGNFPVFLPSQNVASATYGMLKGRPLVLSEHANAASAQGDINLVSLKGYRTITKAGGLQTATSMHLYFDADLMAFRFIFRMNGKPILSKPVTPPKGNNTRSYAVSLQAR